MWRAVALSIFPEMFPGPLAMSLAGRALREGIWSIDAIDIRGFARDRHGSVDDTPFGGGAGMVMRPDVLSDAIQASRIAGTPAIYPSPRGAPLTQARVRELAAGPGVTLVCGRFEGIDERVIEAHGLEEVSVGDFVLSGGEIAAMALLDAVARLQPGVLNDEGSHQLDSFNPALDGLLDCPHYTRPEEWDGHKVPAELMSGHHAQIERWRRDRRLEITARHRPELIEAARAAGRLSKVDEAFLSKQR